MSFHHLQTFEITNCKCIIGEVRVLYKICWLYISEQSNRPTMAAKPDISARQDLLWTFRRGQKVGKKDLRNFEVFRVDKKTSYVKLMV